MSDFRGQCIHCKESGGFNFLRPFGPDGALVCFDCMMATPERQAEGERIFSEALLGGKPVSFGDAKEPT